MKDNKTICSGQVADDRIADLASRHMAAASLGRYASLPLVVNR